MKKQVITSTQHPLVKRLVKLQNSKKMRAEAGQLLIFGKKTLSEMKKKLTIEVLITQEGIDWSIDAPSHVCLSSQAFKKICPHVSPDGAAALVKIPQFKKTAFNLALYCDQIQDPGNLGAIFRCGKAFGVDVLYYSAGSADPFHPKVISSSKAYSLTTPSFFLSKEQLIRQIHEGSFTTYVADMQGKDIRKKSFSYPAMLVLGNEGQGVSKDLMQAAERISIAMSCDVESLNVAVTAGIILFEMGKNL